MVPYDQAGSVVEIAASYTVIFDHADPTNCPVTSCEARKMSQITENYVTSDLSVEANTPYALSAIETNLNGYDHWFRYTCQVDGAVAGTGSHLFHKILRITAPLTCEFALTVDASFANPAPFPYNSAGSTKNLASSLNYFINSQPTDCIIDSCLLGSPGACNNPITSSNINVGSSLGLLASETNPNGYTETICLRCVINSGGGPHYFDRDGLTIQALPLDCSNALTPISFPSPQPI